jgi:hypothetical protein
MANYRYVAPMQEPILMPFEQKMQMSNADLAKAKNDNDLANQRLKQLYGITKGEEWDQIFVTGFGKLKQEVVRRLESGYYPNSAAFQGDLNRLDTAWNTIDNMYRMTKEAASRYDNIMQNPRDYEDEYTEVTETPEEHYAKISQASNFGVRELNVDLENISLGNAVFDMIGVVNDEGVPTRYFEGPLEQSPIYGRTDWLTPRTATRAYIQPVDERNRYQETAQSLFTSGRRKSDILEIISKQLEQEYRTDKKKNAAVTRWWTEAEGMIAGDARELDPVTGFVDEVEKLISMYIDDLSRGRGGSGSSTPVRTIEDVRYYKDTDPNITVDGTDMQLYKISAITPAYDKDYAIDMGALIGVGAITEELVEELGAIDENFKTAFIPTSFSLFTDGEGNPSSISIDSFVSSNGDTIPVEDKRIVLNLEDPNHLAAAQLIERRMKALYGDEFTLFRAADIVNRVDETTAPAPDVDFGTW